jgi:hemerythrin-like domain-containing protein
MPELIEVLREEHRNIEKLLLVLEREFDVFARREQPDYEVVHAVIGYFKEYPDRCHHPKEDMVYDRLKTRDPVAAKIVGDIEADHQQGAQRLRLVAQAVDRVLGSGEVLRETVNAIIHDFIERERHHIAMEERILFPAALRTLRLEDWAEIDARWNDETDPLFGKATEEKYQSLRDCILQWEREAEAERA